ncbi:MAG: YdcF family protein [Candidatus Magasanikbacteria bacterium]|nr:YdcF family protein [Candidatus Magasanikbacteria bacterium]
MKISFKKIILAIAVTVLFFVASIILSVRYPYRDRMFVSHPDLKAQIIVLGSKVEENGEASDWLAYRVLAGVEYWRKRANEIYDTCRPYEARDIGDRCDPPKIVLSGDNGWKRADEITAMREVPALDEPATIDAVTEDGWNARTIDSCWRAKNVLGIDRAILVTQKFHMPRALYLCNKLGVDSYGVIADNGKKNVLRSYLRDWLASVKAWWDVGTGYVPEHVE